MALAPQAAAAAVPQGIPARDVAMYLFRLLYLRRQKGHHSDLSFSWSSATMVSAGVAGAHVQPVLE